MIVPNVAARLTPDEIASLREVSRGGVQRAIPFGNRQRLVELGFVEDGSGALALTELGRLRIAMGK